MVGGGGKKNTKITYTIRATTKISQGFEIENLVMDRNYS